jgi:hypothetical protein
MNYPIENQRLPSNEASSNIADEMLDLIPDRSDFVIARFECRVSN